MPDLCSELVRDFRAGRVQPIWLVGFLVEYEKDPAQAKVDINMAMKRCTIGKRCEGAELMLDALHPPPKNRKRATV